MSRSRGRRYNEKPKLNFKKVFAVIIAIFVIVMFVIGIKKVLLSDKDEKITNESYHTSFENNKYGVINSKGESIIEPSYAELIVIPNINKDVFICTYDVDYSAGTYKTKALNSKNEEIYTEYDGIEALEDYDKNNNVTYVNEVLKTKKDNKYGLISIDGNEILACEYDNIYKLRNNENSIVIEKDGKVGLVDYNGKKVIDINYKEIKALSDDYKNGYIVVNEEGKYGTVDCANNIVLDTTYNEVKPIYDNGMYVVKSSTGYNVVDKENKIITKKEYQEIKAIRSNQIIVKENDKYGVINTSNEQIIPSNYEEIEFGFTNTFIISVNQKYGIINSNNENIVECKYQTATYIKEADIIEASEDGIYSDIIDNKLETKLNGIVSEINTEKGYIRIREAEEYKYYNFKFEQQDIKSILPNNNLYLSKKDGKYGYVDSQGNVIVDYIYDDATEQNNFGYAAVNKDGKWGSIDKNGNVVAPIENDLNSNSIIDFIEKWHLMMDSNLNAYTK